MYHIVWHLVWHFCRRSSRTFRINKGKCTIVFCLSHDIKCLLKIFLCFSWKTYDNICCQCWIFSCSRHLRFYYRHSFCSAAVIHSDGTDKQVFSEISETSDYCFRIRRITPGCCRIAGSCSTGFDEQRKLWNIQLADSHKYHTVCRHIHSIVSL